MSRLRMLAQLAALAVLAAAIAAVVWLIAPMGFPECPELWPFCWP